jgi:hypothetical protein
VAEAEAAEQRARSLVLEEMTARRGSEPEPEREGGGSAQDASSGGAPVPSPAIVEPGASEEEEAAAEEQEEEEQEETYDLSTADGRLARLLARGPPTA